MFVCYVCGAITAELSAFSAHISCHAYNSKLTRPIRCCQGSCSASFVKPYNFLRHVKAFHSGDGQNPGVRQSPSVSCDVTSHAVPDMPLSIADESSFLDSNDVGLLDTVKQEGTALVASLRANSSIPYSIVPEIMESFNRISKSVVTACQREAMLCFSSHVPDSGNNVAESFAQDLCQNLQQFEQPIAFLDSKYKQDSVFDNHPSFVLPKSVNFGMRFETRRGKTKTVYDTFQYVSVQDTLKVLLQNEQYMSGLLQAKKQNHDSDVIGHFTDGELAKSHPLFSQADKFSVMIQLFYDGMGTTNPLCGQSVLCILLCC